MTNDRYEQIGWARSFRCALPNAPVEWSMRSRRGIKPFSGEVFERDPEVGEVPVYVLVPVEAVPVNLDGTLA